HLNDVAVIAPFFSGPPGGSSPPPAEGRASTGEQSGQPASDRKLLGYAATIAHHTDIGGYAPGGYCVSTEIYQEGIIVPPIRLVSRGKIVEDVFQLILANIRSPRQMAGDFRAQIAASLLGQRRTGEIIAKFGGDIVETFVDDLIDYTERWSRQEIATLPEGVYRAEGFLDDDGITGEPIRLVVTARVKGGEVWFDLTGSDPQRSSPMNATLTQTYSPLAYVIKCLIDPNVPTNEGFYKLIHLTAPEGTVVNARPPVGVVGGWEVAMRLCDLTFKAFADALPRKVVASTKSTNCHMACGGRDPRSGEYYAFIETMCGGYGGRPTKDGLDAVQSHIQNTENSAIEETENNYPFMITRYELRPDSEGAGRFRGGLGIRRDWKFVDHAATFTVFAESRKFPPFGLFEGRSGAAGRYILNPDGENRELPGKITLSLKPGDVISYRTPGGGGYGPVLERDPELVLQDVIDGKVTPGRAREIYGVVVDPENRRLDAEATAGLRARIKKI
ncbi:MAG: hydantoinase B/oxoprolinase family protein, partial [Acidobacteria bacterium]|nr:hydantoinase B/oxoprolinase family protein [Acidobacteriota bacterium]